MPIVRSVLSALARAAGALYPLGVDANGVLIGPSGNAAPLTKNALAGRLAVRGRRHVLIGGSETARGLTVKPVAVGGLTLNSTTKVATVVTTTVHNMHTGALVFIASENSTAPSQNGGVITVDNFFTYGAITVVDGFTFTVPYWPLMAGTPYYDTGTTGSGGVVLNGTNTVAFSVFRQQILSPDSKFWEANRWLGFPLTLVMDIATGSNTSMHMVERLPALVALAKTGSFDHLTGTLGVGNTLLYAQTNSWTTAQALAQISSDVSTFCNALAPYGITVELETPIAQANATGITVGSTIIVIEMLRALAANPHLRLVIQDDFTSSYDPSTGLERSRYQRSGTDNVHPSNEACVFFGRARALSYKYHTPPPYRFHANSLLDSYRSDSTVSKQYFDYLVAATPTVVASTLDAKCTGVVPDLITGILTSGNAGRAVACSYEQIGEDWWIVLQLTAAAANDTFNFSITNKAGARQLFAILNVLAGHTFRAGCDFSFVPVVPGAWTEVNTTFLATLSYGAITNRGAILAADSSNESVYTDGPLTGPRNGPALLPDFTLPAGSTCTTAELNFTVKAAAAGVGTLYIGKLTLRDVT